MRYLGKITFINEKTALFLIFLIAVFLRILVVMSLPAEYKVPKIMGYQFDNMAVNFLTGKGLIIEDSGFVMKSWKGPGYPLFLILIYSIFGHNYLVVWIIQCILSALICIIIFFIAKEIFSRKAAFLSAVITAFYPSFIYNRQWGPGFLDSEVFFSFLFALFILFLITKLFAQLNLKNGLISGFLMGFLALTKPFIVLFPAFLFFLILYKNKFLSVSILKEIIPFIIGFVIIIAPWVVRNYVVHKAFVPFCTEGGLALYGSNNAYAKGGGLVVLKPLFPQKEYDRMLKMSEVEVDRLLRRYGKEFLLKNYKKLPKLFFKKLLVQWDVFATDYDIDEGRRYNIFYAIILIFGIFGIIITVKSGLNINSLLLISLFFYSSFIAMIFSGDQRLRYPIEPFLIIFASAGILGVYNAVKNKLLSFIIIISVIAINLMFYVYQDQLLNRIRHIFSFIGI